MVWIIYTHYLRLYLFCYNKGSIVMTMFMPLLVLELWEIESIIAFWIFLKDSSY